MNGSEILFLASKSLARKNYLSARKFLSNSLYWNATDINQYQINAIANIIQFAFKEIPYYKKLFEKNSINPNKIKNA